MSDQLNNVELIKDGDIGILKLNNPPENYLINPEFIELDLLKNFVVTGIKGLIITGVGRHFSAGADLKTIIKLADKPENLKTNLIKGNQLLNYIENLEIPVISAISGICFGGGLEIALSCHIRIASRKALFAFPETNHELVPGLNGIAKTQKLAGKLNTFKLILSGDTINTSTALKLNLIDEITDQRNVLDFVLTLLKNITSDRSLKIINTIMKSINNSRKLSYEDAMIKDAEMFCQLAMDEAKRRKES
jgi:enoyl-CoA hydratase/carnithine racemase